MSKKETTLTRKFRCILLVLDIALPDLKCVVSISETDLHTQVTDIFGKNRISEISGLEDHEITALDGKFLHADFYKDMLKYDNIMIAEDGIECSKDNDKVFFTFPHLINTLMRKSLAGGLEYADYSTSTSKV